MSKRLALIVNTDTSINFFFFTFSTTSTKKVEIDDADCGQKYPESFSVTFNLLIYNLPFLFIFVLFVCSLFSKDYVNEHI